MKFGKKQYFRIISIVSTVGTSLYLYCLYYDEALYFIAALIIIALISFFLPKHKKKNKSGKDAKSFRPIIHVIVLGLNIVALLMPCVLGVWATVSKYYLFDGTLEYIMGIMVVVINVMIFPRALSTKQYTKYRKKNYLLYLRSFTYDEKQDYVLPFLYSAQLPVMKVGDPSYFSANTDDIDTFYLPSKNWHEQLDNYIDRASLVFCVLNNTPGILWEIFNHLDQKSKFIYFYSDRDMLLSLVNAKHNKEYDKTILMQAIIMLLDKRELKATAFHIDNHILYYGRPEIVLDHILGSINSPLLNTATLDY